MFKRIQLRGGYSLCATRKDGKIDGYVEDQLGTQIEGLTGWYRTTDFNRAADIAENVLGQQCLIGRD